MSIENRIERILYFEDKIGSRILGAIEVDTSNLIQLLAVHAAFLRKSYHVYSNVFVEVSEIFLFEEKLLENSIAILWQTFAKLPLTIERVKNSKT